SRFVVREVAKIGLRRVVAALIVVELLETGENPREGVLIALEQLDETCLSVVLRGSFEPLGLLELRLVDRPKRGVGEEVLAAQAGVWVGAGLNQREPAVAVRERLFGAGDVVLHPRGLRERALWWQRDPLATDVDPLLPASQLAH